MPLASQIHEDTLLSNVSVKYRNSLYVWQDVFPQVMVGKDNDNYRIYTRNFRVPETKRAQRAEAREHDFNVSFGSYILENHALKAYVSDDEKANYDQFDLMTDTVEELTDALMRRVELDVANLFTT